MYFKPLITALTKTYYATNDHRCHELIHTVKSSFMESTWAALLSNRVTSIKSKIVSRKEHWKWLFQRVHKLNWKQLMKGVHEIKWKQLFRRNSRETRDFGTYVMFFISSITFEIRFFKFLLNLTWNIPFESS